MSSNQQPIRKGPIDSVPCPWCGQPNDFRMLAEQQLLDTGHRCFCDHCGMSMEVAAVRPVTIVAVRQDPKGGRAQPRGVGPGAQPGQRQMGQPQAAPKRGIGGFVRGLLGGPPKR